ncbi:MAG: amidohydrolase [Candidatus Adiutrix sp.]|jgi:predicted amidohydrolase YtcJ|nr:amidohydrolase [Candidatus Adiutrix sp.]
MSFDYSYADVAFKNGKVLLVDAQDGTAEAVAVKGNKIVFAGTNAELEKIIDPKTKVIDLAGRTLMPGMNDTHYHPILSGLLGPELDAAMINTYHGHCASLAEMLETLKKALALKKPGQWVSMMGYEPTLFPECRHPTIEELDAIAPNNPVHCMHGGGHICMYNTKALAYLGVFAPADAAKFPPDEVEVIDGKLTGMVRGHTHFRLWKEVEYTQEHQAAAAMKARKHLLENGVTSITDCGECDAPSYHIMQKICRDGSFTVRCTMALHSIFGKSFSMEDNDHWLGLGLTSGLGDEHFRIGPCKFMIDGGSGGPSCATREPYSHNPNLPREKGWEREEVAEYIGRIHDAECQATAHAIGDEAIEYMVEGYEKAFAKNPRPDLRHRIEHCTIVDQDLVERMAKMDICPSVNVSSIQKLGGAFKNFYGEERNRYICALRSMLDAGVHCSLHSDFPSYPAGLALIDAAVNRYDRTKNEQCDRTQAITVLEAVRCVTLHGAYATYEEDIKGSIEPGKLADLIILSGDILAIDPMDINDLKVDMTMIDGRIVYER